MDDKNYKADIEERITTLRMSEGDDPAKFLELFSTLLLKAQTANFKLSEEDCCEVTTRSTKVGYLMYLGNSNGVLLVLILSCCEDESRLLA